MKEGKAGMKRQELKMAPTEHEAVYHAARCCQAALFPLPGATLAAYPTTEPYHRPNCLETIYSEKESQGCRFTSSVMVNLKRTNVTYSPGTWIPLLLAWESSKQSRLVGPLPANAWSLTKFMSHHYSVPASQHRRSLRSVLTLLQRFTFPMLCWSGTLAYFREATRASGRRSWDIGATTRCFTRPTVLLLMARHGKSCIIACATTTSRYSSQHHSTAARSLSSRTSMSWKYLLSSLQILLPRIIVTLRYPIPTHHQKMICATWQHMCHSR